MSQVYTPSMKQHEYIEGPRALERFKQTMIQVFQAPKGKSPFAKAKKKVAPKADPKASRRKSGKDKA